MTERLTTLQAVKDWLGITTDASDAQLIRVIEAASQFALNYMNRDSLAAQDYTQNFYGNGKTSELLRNWPVISVSSVGINGKIIPASTSGTGGKPTDGYTLNDPRSAPQAVELHGYQFEFRTSCQVIYRAGFETSQASLIPAAAGDPLPTVVTLTPVAGGQWTADLGVTIDGNAATLVTGDPTTGEYAVDEWGVYSFAAADASKTAIMSYSYAPWDVSQGVTELIGEWYRRKERIGQLSKTLGGQETISYSRQDMNDSIRGMLQPYRNVIPV